MPDIRYRAALKRYQESDNPQRIKGIRSDSFNQSYFAKYKGYDVTSGTHQVETAEGQIVPAELLTNGGVGKGSQVIVFQGKAIAMPMGRV